LLTISILLFAEFLGFTPKGHDYEVEARRKISESLTLQVSMFIPDQDFQKLQNLIRLMVKRYPDILSAGIRTSSGKLVYTSPNHESLWEGHEESGSSTTHVFVPLFHDGKLWGNVELRYRELEGASFYNLHQLPIIKLIAFVSVIGFTVFLLFILRILRQLDPATVIPHRINAAFDTMAEGVIIIDEKEQVLLANSSICEKLSTNAHELIGHKISELNWRIVSTKMYGDKYPWIQVIDKKKSILGSNLLFQKDKHNSIKFALNSSPILSDNGQLQGVLITFDDLSVLEQRNKDLKYIVSKLQQSQLQVQQQNKQLTYLATRDPLTSCLNRRAFNEQFVVLFNSVYLLKKRIEELEEIASNASAELEYAQNYDTLTGLPNQVLFYDRVYQAIEWSHRYDNLSAALVLDIEMLSHINNTLGRQACDELLRQYAKRLSAVLRRSDGITRLSISRLIGDEFAILLTNLNNQTDVTWAVTRLLENTSDPFDIDGHTVHITSRVGISLFPNDANNVDEMLSHTMMAKNYGKKNKSSVYYQYYDTQMQETSIKYLQLDKELFKAIENKQWQLLFQPKVDIKQGRIIGAEALLRWDHPERGLISPFEFMAFAEERKHIIPIGEWVIQQACRQLSKLNSMDINDFQIAINLSGVQLSDEHLVEVILKELVRYDIPPRLLNIEITETAMMDNIDIASKILARLNSRGIAIAVDDFGTGYSSMNYLKTLPISVLKIDRSFIKDICNDPNDDQIVRTMISMAHGLNLRVVAEGVEDKEQLQLLNRYGCDEIQGYLFSRPIPSDELIDIIKHPNETIHHLLASSAVKNQKVFSH
jgi:diguanylate cyclase (GGDEF)-like protein